MPLQDEVYKARYIDVVQNPVTRLHRKVYAAKLSAAWGCSSGTKRARFVDIRAANFQQLVGQGKVFGFESDCPYKVGVNLIRRDLNPPCGVSDVLLLEIRFTGVNLCEPDDTSPCDPDSTSQIEAGQCPDVELTYQGDEAGTWTGSVCFLKGQIDFTLHPPSSPGGNWELTLSGCSEQPGGAMQKICSCPLTLFRPWAVPTGCCNTNIHVSRDAEFRITSYVRPPMSRFIDVVSRFVPETPTVPAHWEKRKVWAWRHFGCHRCKVPTIADIPCCDKPVSSVLQLTITDSSCACLPDQTFEISYNPTNGFWQGTAVCNESADCTFGGSGGITLGCSPGGTWSLQGDGCLQFLFSGTSAGPCRPMLQVFRATFPLGQCQGQGCTITVTEVP